MTAFSIRTFGCRCNQAEAFTWADDLQRGGLLLTDDPTAGDWVLVNTCTLTSRADRDVRNFLRRVGRLNPSARIVVTGCYAERAADEMASYPGVWKVLPNHQKPDVPALVLAEVGACVRENGPGHPFRSRPLVKIQDGCDLGCTYCVIPSVRGPRRSVPGQDIVEQVEAFSERGFEEIVLTGIHLGLYGRDLDPPGSLLGLLRRLTETKGRVMFRLSSLDPRFLSDDLLEFLTGNPRICPQFHLSLQHGADRIIERMGRRITTTDYRRLLDFLRERVPDAALGTDIIVGFPGETEVDFLEMRSFLEESPLSYFHVFSFSPRPGTPAAAWTPVPSKTVKRRALELRTMAEKKNRGFRERMLGRELEGVVIQSGRRDSRVLTGNYIEVRVPGRPAPDSKRVRVRITELTETGALGEIPAPAREPGR